MSICDETPRPTGRTDTAILTGNRFRLELTGREMTRQEWTGSEYYETVVNTHWFEGEASIKELDRPRKRPVHFLFGAPAGKLEDSLFLIGDFDLPAQRPYVPDTYLVLERKPELVDQICERALLEYKKQCRTTVPQISFHCLSYKDLVSQGLAYDPDGQIELKLVA